MKKLIYLFLTVLIVACSRDDTNPTDPTNPTDTTDTTVPVITLNGQAQATINLNTIYIDSGATAIDNIDGDLTSSIVTTGEVNTSIVGNYTITYTVSDSAGNTATARRQVTVEDDGNQIDPIIGIWSLSNEEWIGEGERPPGQCRGCIMISAEGFPDEFIFTEFSVTKKVWECFPDGELCSELVVYGPISYSNLGQGIYSFAGETIEITFMLNNDEMQMLFNEDILQTWIRI
jgi:hypothetical protein